jgi:hypothetical protein
VLRINTLRGGVSRGHSNPPHPQNPGENRDLARNKIPEKYRTVVNWFDQLEKVLEAEAKRADLLGHGSTLGQAREFVIARLPKTILPLAPRLEAEKSSTDYVII